MKSLSVFINEQTDLKKVGSDILAFSTANKSAKPFKNSNNLVGTFSVIVYDILQNIQTRFGVVLDVVDKPKSKLDWLIMYNGDVVFDSYVAKGIDDVSAAEIEAVIALVLKLNIDVDTKRKRFAKKYMKQS